MRIAEICPTCATYINASCILYDGLYLSTIGVSPLDSLEVVLSKINDTYASQSGSGAPTTQIPLYIGQKYIDTLNSKIWVGLSTTEPIWALSASYSTTSTTTTAP